MLKAPNEWKNVLSKIKRFVSASDLKNYPCLIKHSQTFPYNYMHCLWGYPLPMGRIIITSDYYQIRAKPTEIPQITSRKYQPIFLLDFLGSYEVKFQVR